MGMLWTAICLAGLWGFVLCTIGLILKGFPARGAFDRRHSLAWGVGVVFCFIVWIVGMANA